MEQLHLLFVMLALIVLSNLTVKAAPWVSLPLHQIGLGVLLGLFPISRALHLETEMFMLLFVAPLLYMDSKHVQNRDLWKYKTPILLLALGLVFSTTLIVGPFISWLVPGLPLAASLALAAILSPTDAVSVKAISGKINMPHGTKTIIEGESLLNDASGLVAFKFALAAQVTGVFSPRAAVMEFLAVSFGGIAVGVALVYTVTYLARTLLRLGVTDANVFALIQIASPFLAFLAAEHLGFSGVLAVVSAGVFASMNRALIITMHEAHIRFVSDGAWSTLLFVLNGLVFVLLGMHIPIIVQSRAVVETSVALDIGAVLVIYALIMVVRFVWVLLLHKGEGTGRTKNALLISLSGVKGAITLAACFSIPLVITLADGTIVPFYERDLILFISGGVIIVSILVASAVLPVVFPKEAGKKLHMEADARKKLLKSAIDQVSRDKTNDNAHAAGFLFTYYEGMLLERTDVPRAGDVRLIKGKEMALLKTGLAAERDELERLLLLKDSGFDLRALLYVKKTAEYKLSHLEKRKLFKYAYLQLRTIYDRAGNVNNNELARVKMHTTDVAINAVSEHVPEQSCVLRRAVTAHFRYKLYIFLNMYPCETSAKYSSDIRRLAYRARQAERTLLYSLYKQGEIDNATRVRLMLDIELEEVAQLGDETQTKE